MLRLSHFLIFSVLLSSILGTAAIAGEHPEIVRFCTWKANAARVIAMNRDIGLDEVQLTGYYLEQNNSYDEQKIVLDLISKIYGTYQFVSNDTIYSQTRKTCVRDFYMDPAKKVIVSH